MLSHNKMAATNVLILDIFGTPCIYVINADNSILMSDYGSKSSKLSNDMSQANICEVFITPKIPHF